MNTKRRNFLSKTLHSTAIVLAPGLLYACGGDASSEVASQPASQPPNLAGGNNSAPSQTAEAWRMPDEAEPHAATWMAFGASEAIWGRRLLNPVRDSLAGIANAIVAFEPVNMLVRQQDLALARQKCDPRIKLIVQEINDLWLRDTGAVFVLGSNRAKAGVGFNFNGWGKKQAYALDRQVAAAMARQTSSNFINSSLTLEGGGIEVDGKGTAIITESCVLNANRNPGVTKAACEKELLRVLGIKKVIWLPGIAGADITDGHTDFYARFVRPGVVVANLDDDTSSPEFQVTKRHLDILRNSRDAQGQALQVFPIPVPRSVRPEFENKNFAAGYINFYVCNGAVVLPEFGDAEADNYAKKQLADLYPGRRIVQLNIDPIAAGGGGIHCTTQQEPLA